MIYNDKTNEIVSLIMQENIKNCTQDFWCFLYYMHEN